MLLLDVDAEADCVRLDVTLKIFFEARLRMRPDGTLEGSQISPDPGEFSECSPSIHSRATLCVIVELCIYVLRLDS